MKRVMIVGQPGSGKSTLAKAIGARTGLPVAHVDHIHHLPGWGERPHAEKVAMARAIEAREAWIFEGGLSATWPHRFARADTIIFLDLPVALRLWRVSWRTWRHFGTTRPDVAPGCPERFNPDFYAFIWRTRHTGRVKPLALLDRPAPGKRRYHLTRPREVARFLAALGPAPFARPAPAHGAG